jgi:hypothetical protein
VADRRGHPGCQPTVGMSARRRTPPVAQAPCRRP